MSSPVLKPEFDASRRLGKQSMPNPESLIKREEPPKIKAKGLQRVLLVIKNFIIRAQISTKKLLYGKWELQSDDKVGKVRKALDRGLLYVLSAVASIDFCKIATTAVNGIQINSLTFDPKNPPQNNATNFEKKKWKLQYRAYQIQNIIDDFKALYGFDTGSAMKKGLKELLSDLNRNLTDLSDDQGGLADTEFLQQYPESVMALNYINNVIGKFSTYIDERLSQEDVKNVLKAIEDIRTVTVVIQSFNRPVAALNVADNLITGGILNDARQQADEFISTRGESLQFINYLLDKAKNLNSVGKSTLGYINLSRTLMKMLLLLIKVLYVIVAWFKGVPISAAFAAVGQILTANETLDDVVKRKGLSAAIARLGDFDRLLREIARLAEILIIGFTEIINKLTLIKLNIESCNPNLAKMIDDVVSDSQQNKNQLIDFINQINEKVETANKSFGAYTIYIISEELVDENITLRRRYGIARDSNNYIVAQSTPTFASWDQIIINEVKFILLSKGLVKTSMSLLSPDQAIIYENAISLLGDDVIEFNVNDINNLNFTDTSTDEIGQFFSNLPGGSKFRKSSRDKIIASNQKLLATIKQSDPNQKYTKSVVVQTQNQTNKLIIEKLEEQKAKLKAEIAAAAAVPVASAAIPKLVKRIQEIDTEIAALKRG